MTIQSMITAASAALLLSAAPALAGGPGGHGGYGGGHGGMPGGCGGGCGGGGHYGGGNYNANHNVNVNVNGGGSAYSNAYANSGAYAGATAYSAINARSYSGSSSFQRGYVGGGTTYVGSGGYSDGYYGGGYGGGYVTSAPVLVGRPPVSAPVGYPVYGFGRDYIGWRPYPGRPVDCNCRRPRARRCVTNNAMSSVTSNAMSNSRPSMFRRRRFRSRRSASMSPRPR